MVGRACNSIQYIGWFPSNGCLQSKHRKNFLQHAVMTLLRAITLKYLVDCRSMGRSETTFVKILSGPDRRNANFGLTLRDLIAYIALLQDTISAHFDMPCGQIFCVKWMSRWSSQNLASNVL